MGWQILHPMPNIGIVPGLLKSFVNIERQRSHVGGAIEQTSTVKFELKDKSNKTSKVND